MTFADKVTADQVTADESALFRESVRGIKRGRRAYQQERHVDESAAAAATVARKKAAESGARFDAFDPPPAGVLLDTTDGGEGETVVFARGGVQKNTVRKLKRGEIRPAARLDLHGHTAAEAEAALGRFLSRPGAAGQTAALVIHGKGLRSGAAGGVLKSVAWHCLKQHPAVLAFCSAQPRDGGSGAVYVLLRAGRRAGR